MIQMIRLFLMIVVVVSPLNYSTAAETINTSGLTFTDYEIEENLVYGHKDGLALTLDVLTPKNGGKGIGLILVSSGSWKSSKSNIEMDNIRKRNEDHWAQGLLAGGFTLFVVRHGSSPRYLVPEIVEDIIRSVRYVRTIASDHGVDPNSLGITSGSSGGHLSLMAAMKGDDGNPNSKDPIERVSSRVQCTVAWFPPTDLVNWGGKDGYKTISLFRPQLFKRMFGEITDLKKQLKEISPIYFVSEKSPPLLLIHGDSDTTVPLQQSKILNEKCKELNVPVKLVIEPGGGHSYWSGIKEEYEEVWKWFDKHLGRV
jgi:acetyl esterase/lipase